MILLSESPPCFPNSSDLLGACAPRTGPACRSGWVLRSMGAPTLCLAAGSINITQALALVAAATLHAGPLLRRALAVVGPIIFCFWPSTTQECLCRRLALGSACLLAVRAPAPLTLSFTCNTPSPLYIPVYDVKAKKRGSLHGGLGGSWTLPHRGHWHHLPVACKYQGGSSSWRQHHATVLELQPFHEPLSVSGLNRGHFILH